jgi:hypothetical protein
MTNLKNLSIIAVMAVVGVGCKGGASEDGVASVPPRPVPPFNFDPKVEAGVPVAQSVDTTEVPKLVAMNQSQFSARSDPFSLMPAEKKFDMAQLSERVFSETGGFGTYFDTTDSVNVKPLPVVEAQPYRRLSGVVIADAVLAIIEVEGQEPQIIRPGQMIPNTEWRVISIDEEKAVLRRAGNRLPRQVTVKLESPPAQFGGGGNAGAGPGFGGPSGAGRPGGPGGGGPSFGGALGGGD